MITWLFYVLVAVFCIILRASYILKRSKSRAKKAQPRFKTCSLAVFLGSGGHTSEVLRLVSALDFDRYSPRTYIISHGDILSAQKAVALESAKAAESASHCGDTTARYNLLMIPRARRVHQSLLTIPLTSAKSLAICIYHCTVLPLIHRSVFADVLLLNGPGTCFMLCLASYLNRFLGLPSPRLIYIESFARVRSLSLSGRLLTPFVDRFLVQWPDLAQQGKGEYRGWLV